MREEAHRHNRNQRKLFGLPTMCEECNQLVPITTITITTTPPATVPSPPPDHCVVEPPSPVAVKRSEPFTSSSSWPLNFNHFLRWPLAWRASSQHQH